MLEDWAVDQHRLAETERRMEEVLDELGLTTLVTLIHGIGPVGAAAILAETGDPHRFATARSMVKHAGLAPREKEVRDLHRQDQAHRPRPTTTPASRHGGQCGDRCETNTVYATRYRHLTSREQNRLTATQAQTAIAATLLRQLHAVATTGQAWDPVIASGGTNRVYGALGRLTLRFEGESNTS